MKRPVRQLTAFVTLLSMFATGCAPSRPFYFFDDGDLSHYRGVATEIEYPDTQTVPLDEVSGAQAPLTVANNEPSEFWDLTLEEAIRNSLSNSRVMRQLGGQLSSNLTLQGNGFTNAPSQLTAAPASAPTVYLPALADSDPRFGTEAALAAFDAQLNSSLFFQRNDRPLNLNPALQIFSRQVFEQDLGTFNHELSKTTASGSKVFLRNNTNFEWNNNPSNFFPSVWTPVIETEFRHPLLQGSGVDFNRIAGPNSTYGTFNGVVLARINTDIQLSDFEAGVRNVVSDTENIYWTLYYGYRNLDANVAGRDSSLQTWRKVHAMAQAGAADAAQEAQAREQYFLFRSQVEDALSNLYSAENRLRYMMGLAPTDGRLIRPSDEPTTAKVVFDWQESHTEAQARAVELRRQRWLIKRREMELVASKNFLLPRLDASALYRWRGFGDDLVSANGGGKAPFSYAYNTLLHGDFQEWQLGVNFNMPIGFRQGLAGVRNAQLQLARERAVLQDQELEVSHQLAEAIRSLDRAYMLSQTHFNRRVAAKRQVEAVQQNYEVGRITLDQLLDAQRRLADAEARYYESLSQYNRSITSVHFRKGSLLEYNAVFLAEGPWASKAYFDAEERARKRDAGIFLDYGFTRPEVFSQGPVEQNVGTEAVDGTTIYEGELLPESARMQDAPTQPSDQPAESGTAPGPTPAPAPVPTPAPPSAPTAPLPSLPGAPSFGRAAQVNPTSPMAAGSPVAPNEVAVNRVDESSTPVPSPVVPASYRAAPPSAVPRRPALPALPWPPIGRRPPVRCGFARAHFLGTIAESPVRPPAGGTEFHSPPSKSIRSGRASVTLTIRPLTPDDIPLGMRLKSEAGWNQTVDDWRRAFELEPTGCFVGCWNEVPVATLTTCVFDDIAWIAMVLTDGAYRGRGIASQLMGHALAALAGRGVRSVRLDATDLGRPVYEKFGFQVDFCLTRYTGRPTAAPEAGTFPLAADTSMGRLTRDQEEAAYRLDRGATGTNRARLLRRLAAEKSAQSLGITRAGQIVGYLLSRGGSSARQIGPAIADDADVGQQLLRAGLEQASAESVFLDLPDENRRASQVAIQYGLAVQRGFFRMTRGAPVAEDRGKIWASCGPEKG